MSDEIWQAPAAATLHADEKDVNELTPISPNSATPLPERSFGLHGARAAHVAVERCSKLSAIVIDTSAQTIVRWNITRFCNLLLAEFDTDKRMLVSKLLAEEEAKLLRSGPSRGSIERHSSHLSNPAAEATTFFRN